MRRWFGSSSIAARLFAMAALWSLVILTVAGLLLTALYRSTAEAALDDQLSVYLRALVADLATPGADAHSEPGSLGEPQFELSLSGWYWQITRLDGGKTEIRSSRSLFAAHLPRLDEQSGQPDAGGRRRGYVIGPDERRLRMLERLIDIGDQGKYLVQVAATTQDLESQIAQFEVALAITFTLLALALVGTTALQVAYGLRPLKRLRDGVMAVRRGQAEQIDGEFPYEIAPLASELNLLIGANRDIVARARTQVGNLAHALKTPLSVIMNEAAGENDPVAEKAREQALLMRDQVNFYLERASAAARAGAIGAACDVEPAIAGLVRTFAKIYPGKTLAFAGGAESLRFLGERQDLEDMLGNLIDNACKWARQEVRVAIQRQPPANASERAMFTALIDDDGPGLPQQSREKAARRGQRLDESKPGSGLGLSIVTELAADYGGALTLETSPIGGLRALLTLPQV